LKIQLEVSSSLVEIGAKNSNHAFSECLDEEEDLLKLLDLRKSSSEEKDKRDKCQWISSTNQKLQESSEGSEQIVNSESVKCDPRSVFIEQNLPQFSLQTDERKSLKTRHSENFDGLGIMRSENNNSASLASQFQDNEEELFFVKLRKRREPIINIEEKADLPPLFFKPIYDIAHKHANSYPTNLDLGLQEPNKEKDNNNSIKLPDGQIKNPSEFNLQPTSKVQLSSPVQFLSEVDATRGILPTKGEFVQWTLKLEAIKDQTDRLLREGNQLRLCNERLREEVRNAGHNY